MMVAFGMFIKAMLVDSCDMCGQGTDALRTRVSKSGRRREHVTQLLVYLLTTSHAPSSQVTIAYRV
jgi:hypothetical protein